MLFTKRKRYFVGSNIRNVQGASNFVITMVTTIMLIIVITIVIITLIHIPFASCRGWGMFVHMPQDTKDPFRRRYLKFPLHQLIPAKKAYYSPDKLA